MQFLQEHLPAIVAGLFPSLITFGTTIVIIIKNLKVNKNVDDLFRIANDIKLGKFDLEDIMKTAPELIHNIVKDFNEEFNEAKDKLVEDFNRDLENAKEELTNTFKEQQAVFQEQIRRLEAINKKIKLGGD